MSFPSMTLLSVDMDKPLNKAHWHERQAQTLLKQGKWDDAEASYDLATELMRKALNEASSTPVAESLQLQVIQLERTKDVIKIRRKEAARYSNAEHYVKHPFGEDGHPSIHDTEEESTKTKQRANSTDKGTETSHVYQKPTRRDSQPNTWQFIQLAADDIDRPKDSLLPLFLRRDEEISPLDAKKIPKSKEAIVEEYKTRLSVMQDMLQQLMKQLQDKEEENEMLKGEVRGLRSEVSSLNERLEVYEGNKMFQAMNFADKDPLQENFTGDMTASMLMDQPESYFEFEGKNVETELDDALQEDRKQRVTPPSGQELRNYRGPLEDQSVQYQDLDEGLSTEVSEALSNSPAGSGSAGSSLQLASLAGLPPLSPVHFELNDKGNIFPDKNSGKS